MAFLEASIQFDRNDFKTIIPEFGGNSSIFEVKMKHFYLKIFTHVR